MKKIVLLLTLFYGLAAEAQIREQLYDYKWQPAPAEKALYISYVEKDSGLYHRRDYYIREKRLQMDGYYRDSACNIRHGKFYYFYPDGSLQTKSSYEDDELEGEYMSYHVNGMVEDSGFLHHGHYTGQSYSWHKNGFLQDSLLLQDDGSGTLVSWHDNGNLSAAGFYGPGGKKIHTWQYFHPNGKLASKEKFSKGKLVETQYFDEDGVPETDTTNTDRELSFPGGSKAWDKYVNRHIYFPTGWTLANAGEAVVIVTATVNEEGKVVDAYVSTAFHPEFDPIALKMMKGSPKWLPAISHHRKIKGTIRQAINFVRDN